MKKQHVLVGLLVLVFASGVFAQVPEPIDNFFCGSIPGQGIVFGHEELLVSIASIENPRDVTVSDNGIVFAVDVNAVFRIDPAGSAVPILQGLTEPWDIATSPGGTIFVTDRASGRIHAVGQDGSNPRVLDAQLLEPTGIVFSNGNLFVNDTAAPGRIVRVNPAGGQDIISEQFAALDGITVSPDGGTLFVVDPALRQLVRVGTDGQNKEIVTTNLSNPSSCSTTPGGLILINDDSRPTIVDPSTRSVSVGPDLGGGFLISFPENVDVVDFADDYDVADDFVAFGDDRFVVANDGDADVDSIDEMQSGDVSDDGDPGDTAFGDDRFGLIDDMDAGDDVDDIPPGAAAAAGLLVLAGAVGIANAATKKYDPKKDPYAGSVDMVPKDPCEELRKQAEADEAAADAAAGEASTTAGESQSAADAATKAQAEADAANKELTDAEKELKDASVEPDTDDYVEDEEGRIDEHDLRLKNEASKAAWAKYQNGEMTAQELEAEWERLGDRDAIEALREADEKNRAERKEKAEQRVKDAKADAEAKSKAATEANAAAKSAADKAAEARAKADAAKAKAEKSRAAADECEKKMRAQYAADEAKRKAEAEARQEELEELENLPPAELESREVVVGGGGGKGTNCCPTGIWVGYGGSTAGVIGIGYETSWITFVCVDRPCCYVTMQSTTWRFGLALGGEVNAIGGVAVGPTDPAEFEKMYKNEVSGVNADLSIGAPIAKAGKVALKSAKSKKLLKTMQKLGKAKTDPKKAAKDIANIKDMVKEGVAKEMIKKGAQGGTGGMVTVPIGPALQVGVWYGFGSNVYITDRGWCD